MSCFFNQSALHLNYHSIYLMINIVYDHGTENDRKARISKYQIYHDLTSIELTVEQTKYYGRTSGKLKLHNVKLKLQNQIAFKVTQQLEYKSAKIRQQNQIIAKMARISCMHDA